MFRAFSEAEHLAQWWGPAGFTNTFHDFDLRAGAPWRYTMHGPNGADYPNDKTVAIPSNEQNLDRLEARLAGMA